MADNIMARRFFQPVYKSDGSGDLIEAGDTLKALLGAANGTRPIQNLVLSAVSEDAQTLYWEYDATNNFTRSEDVVGVDPDHQITCPPEINIGLVAVDDITVTVTAFVVNGVAYSGSYPVTAEGAAALQAALQDAVGINGAVTVVYVDAATDYLQVYVMGTTATITVNGDALVELA
jgi:hypothetical protein